MLKESEMSKRARKDIKSMSADVLETDAQLKTPVDEALAPALTIEGTEKKTRKRTTTRAARKELAVATSTDDDDPELQALLLQVDKMLTEMTQSKWMSPDWPNLEIGLGQNQTNKKQK